MTRRVVITGLGTYNPLGNDPETTWQMVVAGRSGIDTFSGFDASDLKSQIGGQVKEFDPVALFGRKDARRMDRVTQFAQAAAAQALADAGLQLSEDERRRCGVIMGSGMGNVISAFEGFGVFYERGPSRVSPFFVPMMLFDAPAASISITHGLQGPNIAIATACAASNNALGEAAKMIQHDAADVMLAGGSEAALAPVILAGFSAAGALSERNDDPLTASRPFDKDRDGFVCSEGAAVLVLEELGRAEARGAHIYGELLGYGSSADAYHLAAPSEDGSGAAQCMQIALDDAGLAPGDIDYINAHGTSTQLNDKSETRAIKTVFGPAAYDIPISSTKSMHGHLLGAGGALEAIICLKAIADGFVPPTINYETPDPECDLDIVPNTGRQMPLRRVLSNSFGLGGHNATIILGKYDED
jgi:3-oxoacyl-[acyl-carrier-protein] synthase II